MASVELTPDTLTVHVIGLDKLWALKSRLDIPLGHVIYAELDNAIAREWWHGIRAPGTAIPGVIAAGTFYRDGQRVFWDVHDPDRVIVIHLADEQFARLVIQVDDPEATVAAITQAIRYFRGP